jgi:hypothetical protein
MKLMFYERQHLGREAGSGVIGHTAAPEPTSEVECGPEPRDAWQWQWQCFLHQQDIGLSRSHVPIPSWSCDLWRTTKHTIIYPVLGSRYEVIALHLAFFVLKKKNSVTMQ